MDATTYAARFESMRKNNAGASKTKQIIVVHKELDRQCKSIIARHRSDAGITTSELRRQQKNLELLMERMRRDQDRCRRDGAKTRRYLADADQRHRDTELRLAAAAEHGRRPSEAEKREEARLEAEGLMKAIDRLVMPPELKLRLTNEINVMYGYLWL